MTALKDYHRSIYTRFQEIFVADALPFTAVIRFAGVALSREALEIDLGVTLDRFELSRPGNASLAQINLPDEQISFESIIGFMRKFGPNIARLVENLSINSAYLDLAFEYSEDRPYHSSTIPHVIAYTVGQYKVNLEITSYPRQT
jgi:hypothetical protein